VRGRGPHQAIGLYAHVTWHTWRRVHAVREPDVVVIAQALHAAGARTRIRVHAQAILADHVHVLVSFPPSATLSFFVREAKSESARRVNAATPGREPLRWCRGFYAGAVCRNHVRYARVYLGKQHQRHPDRIPARVG
jgi:REP-associated tyrosine transposase